jgi:hypothetical protein
VIPDTIDHANLRGVRSSAECASVVEALIRFAHTQDSGPVFLLGTSQGSIAAANGAAHAHPGTLAGVVLTESVSRLGGSHETVFDADLQNIRIPALVVANRNDRFDVAPPQDAPKIAAPISHSPSVRLLQVRGGINASANACASETPHGYYGMESQVVGTISDWVRNPLRRPGRFCGRERIVKLRMKRSSTTTTRTRQLAEQHPPSTDATPSGQRESGAVSDACKPLFVRTAGLHTLIDMDRGHLGRPDLSHRSKAMRIAPTNANTESSFWWWRSRSLERTFDRHVAEEIVGTYHMCHEKLRHRWIIVMTRVDLEVGGVTTGGRSLLVSRHHLE